MATIRDVAKHAGVSVATVSHVINGTRKVAPETEARVRRIMEELGYQPNAIAQSLRKRATYAVGVLVSDITNPFFATLVRGVEDAALEAGYSVIVCNSDEDPEKEDMYIRALWRRRIDGMLIAPTRDGTSPALQELVVRQLPFVFIDRKAKGIDAPAVLSDNEGGAYLATKHLIERGHRRIAIILGINGATTTEERFVGYCRALEDAGIPFSDAFVAWGGYRVEGGRQAIKNLLAMASPPSAIFSTNNLMTVGVLQELVHQSIAIPEDVAVIGLDELELAEVVYPPLTVVAQNPYEIGRRAFEVLYMQLGKSGNKPNKSLEIRIPMELRVRKST
ncbi:MAG: LacI family DNA-binding transcriptional regulator [Candidatus Hadarchaeum sp.]|uniref:LacI family DNA-binding transcriptional regulator n=1 Tax=Candidatus Hadarchaeum sp. TaxID=2883567 RepID=UPI0031816E5E